MQSTYDAIIIGGGFAGLSAALWLGRYRRKVLVISSGLVRNHASNAVHGYPGYEGAKPLDLLKQIHNEASRYAVELENDFVTNAGQTDNIFILTTRANKTYRAKRLLIATGTEDVKVRIPGMHPLEGKTVWHCPACDGYEYTDKRIGIIGWGDSALDYSELFLTYSKDLILFTHGNTLPKASVQTLKQRGICVQESKISNVVKHGDCQTVHLENNTTYEVDAIFYKIACRPRINLARQLGCELVDNAAVRTNHKQETTVPGVYVAGDLAPLEDLVVVACSTGAIAASNIHKSLK